MSGIKQQAVTVAGGGREARRCHRPLLWAELPFHGAFPGWASLRRASLMHSDASLRVSNFPWHMGIGGPLEYRLFKGDDPVPSLEYEGWVRWQLTSRTLQASSRSGGSAHGFRKEMRKMEGDRKT